MNAEILLPCCKQVCFKTIWKPTNVCDVLPKFLLFLVRYPVSCTGHFFQPERGNPLTNKNATIMTYFDVKSATG